MQLQSCMSMDEMTGYAAMWDLSSPFKTRYEAYACENLMEYYSYEALVRCKPLL